MTAAAATHIAAAGDSLCRDGGLRAALGIGIHFVTLDYVAAALARGARLEHLAGDHALCAACVAVLRRSGVDRP
jgi:seryl-tRNA(Sec) selenium transferase